jgi:hypothetical protein
MTLISQDLLLLGSLMILKSCLYLLLDDVGLRVGRTDGKNCSLMHDSTLSESVYRRMEEE